jgi:hypothetical protein
VIELCNAGLNKITAVLNVDGISFRIRASVSPLNGILDELRKLCTVTMDDIPHLLFGGSPIHLVIKINLPTIRDANHYLLSVKRYSRPNNCRIFVK